MTSVERVMAYTKIDSEIGYSTPALPPGSWPSEGRLDLHNLSLVYFDEGPRILKDINVCVSSREKVGVVGRTGAGKSSLVSALFRMPDPLGKVGKTEVCEYSKVNAKQCSRVLVFPSANFSYLSSPVFVTKEGWKVRICEFRLEKRRDDFLCSIKND